MGVLQIRAISVSLNLREFASLWKSVRQILGQKRLPIKTRVCLYSILLIYDHVLKPDLCAQAFAHCGFGPASLDRCKITVQREVNSLVLANRFQTQGLADMCSPPFSFSYMHV